MEEAFRHQARWCRELKAPFTALLCELLPGALGDDTHVGTRVRGWAGDPVVDALPLRLAGGLYALVRRGRVPGLARLYPPAGLPQPEALHGELVRAVRGADAELLPWLDGPPQTNEVGRSAALYAGLMQVAARFGPRLELFELGASAGLNLWLDRYGYRLGGEAFGVADARVVLAPAWEGPAPVRVEIEVVARRGVDVAPVDVGHADGRERLLAYVWPDSPDRLARVEAAIAEAMAQPPVVERGEAAAWLDRVLPGSAREGVTRVVMHSVAFGYFPPETQARVRRVIEGEGAHGQGPVAWLALEHVPGERGWLELVLRVWPGGEMQRLARTDGHVRRVEWAG